jgi:predicted phage-related endonuclease
MDINSKMKELAEFIRLGEEVAANIEGLKDELKAYMQERGTDTIAGTEHKASYKTVESSRIDTTALKQAAPEVAARFTKTTQSKRFIFA